MGARRAGNWQRRSLFMVILKARFDGHVLVPVEPIDLPVGCELEISIMALPDRKSTTLQALAEIAEQFPANADLPTDLAAQHDHYLYGTPKRP
jgi:predicted DNA-binding antitoxin AbrB/MazE fold protein